jgi:hypothetical protein
MAEKPISMMAAAPVVSDDPTSPEAKLAREAKQIQVQTDVDSKFDTVIERFEGGPPSSQPLVAVGVVLLLFGAAALVTKKRRM